MITKEIGKGLLVGAVLFWVMLPWAGHTVPAQINYQGYLTDSAGTPINTTVPISFSLYSDPGPGGTALWTETQNMVVASGVYSVKLGSVNPITLSFDAQYYLGVKVGTDLEMTPRQPLTTVPYAFRAKTVETVTSGAIATPLNLSGTPPGDSVVKVTTHSFAGSAIEGIADMSGSNIGGSFSSWGNSGGGVFGYGRAVGAVTNYGGSFRADGDSGRAVYGYAPAIGNVMNYGGYFEAQGNYGVGVYGESNSGWGVEGRYAGGNFGVLGANGYGVYGRGYGNSRGVWGESDNATGVHGKSANGFGIYGESTNGTGVYGYAPGSAGYGVYGYAPATGDVTNYGGYFRADGNSGRAVYGVASATGSAPNIGGYFEAKGDFGSAIYAKATSTSYSANWGGFFEAYGENGTAVYGATFTSGSAWGGAFEAYGDGGTGVYGWARTGIAGVHGVVESGDGWGVWGEAPISGNGYAGYFHGRVHVAGTLSKSAGSFKIDHPLDPENKFLYHSFVESPDMKNIYDGIAVLDSSGEAWVELPEWFEAVNKDFRYQLTCIGGFAQVYIADEVSENRFKIAGGRSGLKVSWQVTGIRKDAYAEAHRIPVEEAKKPSEQGFYIHPDLFGHDEEKNIEWARRPGIMKKMKAEREKIRRSGGE
jgi:hypothetical protein